MMSAEGKEDVSASNMGIGMNRGRENEWAQMATVSVRLPCVVILARLYAKPQADMGEDVERVLENP